ncbi:MAG: hypothetical protein KA149_00410 [Chitinophagales bacterium]|nr:hypothetical protein [Chitinophagales bacterium]
MYHVFYFMVQYAVIKRIELFYYSLFLLSAATYYFVFHSTQILHLPFRPALIRFFAPIELSFAFIQNYFYISFIIAYLDLAKPKYRLYKLLTYYKYYNLLFLIVFPLLYMAQFNSQNLYGFITLLTLPITMILLIMLWQLKTTYANIILTGTSCSVLGTIISLFLIIQRPSCLGFDVCVPAQISLMLDLFILGYGLSIKAADSDKKLVVALLDNQQLLEEERTRFARDLHDGLGGLLSSVKFSLNNLKDNISLSNALGKQFDQGLNKLDTGIAELRKIAHNMMPENLQQFGLNTALKDFCITIQQGTGCNIHYECFGMEHYSFNSQTDIAIYRIAQELVNNALKHAAAEQIIVQLQNSKTSITLTVEDNGKGFDKSIIKNGKGSGWKSIESRVNLLKGSCLVTSSSIGTTITIDMPI